MEQSMQEPGVVQEIFLHTSVDSAKHCRIDTALS